jgi:hypothetical protein
LSLDLRLVLVVDVVVGLVDLLERDLLDLPRGLRTGLDRFGFGRFAGRSRLALFDT